LAASLWVGWLGDVACDDPAAILKLDGVRFTVRCWRSALDQPASGSIVNLGVPRLVRVHDRMPGRANGDVGTLKEVLTLVCD
jgi:hypothetical protein